MSDDSMQDRPNGADEKDGPDPTLRASLDALPRDVVPPPELWEGLRDAVRAAARDDSRARRRQRRTRVFAGVAIAASLALAVLGVPALVRTGLTEGDDQRNGQVVASTEPSGAKAPLPSVTSSEPRDRAVEQEIASWRAANADPVRSAYWPIEARRALDRAITVTEQAVAEARATLARDPNDRGAREAMDELREQQVVMLQRARALLDGL